MDRLLRLSGAGLGGMGGAQQPADAPVVDTAEQVFIDHLYVLLVLLVLQLNSDNILHLHLLKTPGLHLLPGPAKDVEAWPSRSTHGGHGSHAWRVRRRIHR